MAGANEASFTHDDLIRLSLVRLGDGTYVAVARDLPVIHAVPVYHEGCILPALRNAVSATLMMYQVLDGQRQSMQALIDECERQGGSAETLVPTFTQMMLSCDIACKSALDGVMDQYNKFANAKGPQA